ncbi:MAG: patatin-like phospholipase family protein [Desulfobacterales bacterium]|nr:patatin-like phospholipase family protein [Desulfobacterales bacterium]
MKDINVKPGGFPFELSEGPEESRYLTWVRNHSNYMVERGFLDYMRIVAVLVRGILINFLTLLPYLLLVALLLSIFYAPLLNDWLASGTSAALKNAGWVTSLQDRLGTKPPFLLTPWVALLALFWNLLFPIVIRIFKVITHKESLETGNESSVKLRDRYERSFAWALIVVFGFALIELLPLLVYYFHRLHENAAYLREFVATIAGGASVLAMSGAGALLARLGKVLRPLAAALIGLLGLLLPLLVILYVTEYLVYDSEGFKLAWRHLALVPAALAGGIILAFILGTVKGAFQNRAWLLKLLAIVVAVMAILYLLASVFNDQSWFFVLALAVEIWLFCWLAVDINLTSVHGLYRDRLASAYLVGEDTSGDVDIEEDLDLHEICQHENGSTAPYHLVNVALNLQGSQDMGIRERNSDFFIFSKKYIGSNRTGYCRSETMEAVCPQLDLATAMAISAAAASPNMGALTSPALVAIMTLFNIRLGYWVPNPGRLAVDWARRTLALPAKRRETELQKLAEHFETDISTVRAKLESLAGDEDEAENTSGNRKPPPGFTFEEIFEDELQEMEKRWKQAYGTDGQVRQLAAVQSPTPGHGLVGLAFSGGGIRSATINLGIAQALNERGIFDHVDYMSTVSGGGYLGSSISTLMRKKRFVSEIGGKVHLGDTQDGLQRVEIVNDAAGTREYQIPRTIPHSLEEGQQVSQGDSLVTIHTPGAQRGSLRERFDWRVRPGAFLREMSSRLDETHKWVNVSDGGHIENLGTIELLRRRCKFIITGDGGADPDLHFDSLATLMRYARIDLGIDIDIDLKQVRLIDPDKGRLSQKHFAIGRITYPQEAECGYLLYLKSSFTGDEDEVIVEYRNRNPKFPHESTADQFFDEGQFEAYRALGQHIGECALDHAPKSEKLSYAELSLWFKELIDKHPKRSEEA